MLADLGGSQISALLESVPGIASVLRSPVADSLVAMIRAGAGVGEFELSDAQELVQYAVRRGLIGSDEGDRLLQEVRRPKKAKAAPKAPKARTRPAKAKALPSRSAQRKRR